ncbi:MAG TPA: asparagine--tRNA ligase [Candidatus Gracilibacteria bacterium]
MEVKTLFDEFQTAGLTPLLGKKISLKGWIRTVRSSGEIGFLQLHDGTCFKPIQVVFDAALSNFSDIAKLHVGSAVEIEGEVVESPGDKQPFEIKASRIGLLADCDEDYPLQKKGHSMDFLRTIAHVRPRSNTFQATFRLRSVLGHAIHSFFQDQGFVQVHTPIITGSDCEGAGEMFTVTTNSGGKPEDDFFGKKAGLTVSGQLNAEAFALAFSKVYTFGPTFRAENSNTARHAAEFWMIEPEIAFANLSDDMDLAESMMKHCFKVALEKCPEEMQFFEDRIAKGVIGRLESILKSDFERLPYGEAIKMLEKSGEKFEFPVSWGIDLQSEHEQWLCQKLGKPVFVSDYPKDIKAFYMRLNDDGKTVAAMDLLVPGVGEIIGGSQREERLDVLDKRMEAVGIDPTDLWWYRDLRRFGGVEHAGFGLGFERLIQYVSGMHNIRDVIPFPRTPRHCDF